MKELDFSVKKRWVLSETENVGGAVLPLVRDYCAQWIMPCVFPDGHALVLCLFNLNQFQAVQQDERFVVLKSVHHKDKVHTKVVDKLKKHGVHDQMDTKDLLIHLAEKVHPLFEPED